MFDEMRYLIIPPEKQVDMEPYVYPLGGRWELRYRDHHGVKQEGSFLEKRDADNAAFLWRLSCGFFTQEIHGGSIYEVSEMMGVPILYSKGVMPA